MADPHVSVIVPVRNRRALLATLLDALAAQTYRDFEVVVVDDGSTDGADRLAAAETRVAVRVIRSDGAGAVAARARGVADARGAVLAFTDSDCEPAPSWLSAGVAAIDGGAAVANGPTVSAAPRRLLERSLTAGDDGLYPTCNVFYRRSAFDAAGGFDVNAATRLGFRPGARAKGLGFGEDTVLAWRVRRAGNAAFVPEATVAHAVFPPDLRDHFSRTAQAGAFPALVREVPELRATFLDRRYFLGSPTRVPLYVAVVLLLARQWRAVAVALVVWTLWHALRVARRDDPVKRKVLAFPIVLATDALTAAALVVGSVRAGTLVV
jgi:glycosyltransferase involved in cell wall biosynthesis